MTDLQKKNFEHATQCVQAAHARLNKAEATREEAQTSLAYATKNADRADQERHSAERELLGARERLMFALREIDPRRPIFSASDGAGDVRYKRPF